MKKMCLNEKHIEEQLGYSRLANIIRKFPEYLRKQRQELQKCEKQPCRKFLREDLAVQIIMDCRTTPSIDFKTRLGFKQHNPIMTQKESVLTKLDTFFKTEDKLFQHSVLGYRIDLYVPKYKLAIEVDELGHCTRNIEDEIERQEKIEQRLGCKFIRIDPSKKHFNITGELCKIKEHKIKSTKKSTKKGIIDRISDRL